MSEGVCQSCLSRRQRALSGAERWFATVHQHDVDARYLRKRQDRISGPVPAGNLTAVEHDLLLQGDTDGLNDPALKLVSCTIGVHDTADIGGDHDPRNLDDPGFAIDVYVNDNSRVHSDCLVTRVGKATSALAIALRARGPACLCGRGFDDGTSPRILQMREAESDGIEPSFASASSSMKDSMAKTLPWAPSVRNDPLRIGVSRRR